MITEELFREAQKAIRVRRKREAYKKEENPSPIKGKVKCGSYLKIGLEPLEKAIWNVRQKLAEAYHEEENTCQSKKVQILSAVSKMKERKKILEIQAEHCKSSRLDLYHQWKEGVQSKIVNIF